MVDIHIFVYAFFKNSNQIIKSDEIDAIKEIFGWVYENKYEWLISNHTLTVLNWIFEKRLKLNRNEIEEILLDILNNFEVSTLTKKQFIESVKDYKYNDIEDSIQYKIAKTNNCDCIITLNKKDFKNSDIDICSPYEFVKKLNN